MKTINVMSFEEWQPTVLKHARKEYIKSLKNSVIETELLIVTNDGSSDIKKDELVSRLEKVIELVKLSRSTSFRFDCFEGDMELYSIDVEEYSEEKLHEHLHNAYLRYLDGLTYDIRVTKQDSISSPPLFRPIPSIAK